MTYRALGCAAVVLACARNAGAALSCEDLKALQGPVKDVAVSEGSQRNPSAEPFAALQITQTAHVRADRRSATITAHSTDAAHAAPVTTCEFDARGNVVREVVKLDGRRTHTTTMHTYDREGRLLTTTLRSSNPTLGYAVTHRYDAGARTDTERFAGAAGTRETVKSLDPAGRVVREVEKASDTTEPTIIDHRYSGNAIDTCWRGPDAGCASRRVDAHGNAIERTSAGRTTRYLYEYDGHGNWTKWAALATPIGVVTVRAISYW